MTLLGAALVIDSGVMAQALGHDAGIGDYAALAWMASSLGTIAGGLGAGLESDEAVREAAYGYPAERAGGARESGAGARLSESTAVPARRTGYHLRFSRVIYRGERLRCVRPGDRGLFGNAVLTEAAIESTDSQDFEAQVGIERRRWLCVTTRVDVDVCTAHLNTRSTIEVAGNDAQCVELAALLERRGDARTVTFGGDVNRRRSCAPDGVWTRTDRSAEQAPGLQHVYGSGALRSPSAEVYRPRTPTTTSCWSARTSRHPGQTHS